MLNGGSNGALGAKTLKEVNDVLKASDRIAAAAPTGSARAESLAARKTLTELLRLAKDYNARPSTAERDDARLAAQRYSTAYVKFVLGANGRCRTGP